MELSGTDFFAGYIDEVQSYIPQLNRGVVELQNSPNLGAGFEEFYRLVHIIKGASSMVGVQGLSKIAGYLESALDEIRDGRLEFSESVFAAIRQTIDSFDQYCHKLRNENSLDEEQLEQKIKDVFSGLSVSQIFFDSDIQNGMDELVSEDFLGILGEDSFSETADVPDTVSVSSKLDHSLDLLAGMILEKKILAKTAVEMIDKMHSLISTDYESTPQTTGNRSPLQLLRELSAWMLDSAELEL
jgi:chemotaxis protein histidine kinase CheA